MASRRWGLCQESLNRAARACRLPRRHDCAGIARRHACRSGARAGAPHILTDLGVDVFDELRNIRRFLLQATTHQDSPRLVEDMLSGLRALLDAVEQAGQLRRRAWEQCHLAERRLRQLGEEIEKAESQNSEVSTLNRLRVLLSKATTELASAQ